MLKFSNYDIQKLTANELSEDEIYFENHLRNIALDFLLDNEEIKRNIEDWKIKDAIEYVMSEFEQELWDYYALHY